MKKIFHGDYPVQNHLFYHIHVFSTLKVPRLLNTCCYAYPRSHQCQNLVAYLTPSWEEEWRLDRVFTQVSQRNSEKIFFFFLKVQLLCFKTEVWEAFPSRALLWKWGALICSQGWEHSPLFLMTLFTK